MTFGILFILHQNQDLRQMSAELDSFKGKGMSKTEMVLVKDTNPIGYTVKDVECLARNIFYEAGTEDTFGKYAVAQVTINRAKQGYWGKSICKVVYADDQFSWTANHDLTTAKLDGPNWAESLAVAQTVLGNGLRIKTLGHALFYHADYTNPPWRDDNKRIGQIGHHIFYSGGKDSWLQL
jgi:spore germination cell wall hydrolase CwlJ-like protein